MCLHIFVNEWRSNPLNADCDISPSPPHIKLLIFAQTGIMVHMTDSSAGALALVNALIQNEKLISKLYANYASLFANDSDFWTKISSDETDHARWLDELFIKIKQEVVQIDENRLKLEALTNFTAYINEQIARAETGNITSIQALSVSMDMENSIIEQGVFKVYETDDAELQETFDRLRTATEAHFSNVKRHWLVARKSSE